MTEQSPFQALQEMKELWHDVADGFHLPKRFRTNGMSAIDKDSFLRTLGKAIDALEYRLKNRH